MLLKCKIIKIGALFFSEWSKYYAGITADSVFDTDRQLFKHGNIQARVPYYYFYGVFEEVINSNL